MKPINLKMAGLQSYREEQEIDFTKLCDAGVFGIFGPTGSGKSTILDAITLALFGRVERASGGTQGIMNQAENKLSVAFTFELTGAHGTLRYAIERQFKRNSDVSVNNTVSRLIQINADDEKIVLADKANEVTAEVQQILGLNMADFTRAVVLPQGKFAEFLLLAGKERRAMLQRLFHLERYGDQLSIKVNSKLKATDSLLTAIVAEQAGLGDASESALVQARSEAAECNQLAESARSLLTVKQQAVAAYKEVVDLQMESDKLHTELAEITQLEQEIAELESRIKLAERAERVRPYLEEWESAARLDQEKRENFQQAEKAIENSTERLNQSQSEFDTAHQALQSDEERLITRIEMLKAALDLQKQIAMEEAEASKLKARSELTFAELKQAELTHKQAGERKEKALLLQADLQNKLKAASVSIEQRQKIKEGTAIANDINASQRQLKELEQEAARSKSGLATWKNKRTQMDGQLTDLREEYRDLAFAFANLKEQNLFIERSARRSEQIFDQILLQLKQLRDKHERASLAVSLAKQLQSGEACPVCGSCEHPALADHYSDVHEQAEHELELAWSELMERCEQSLSHSRSLLMEHKGISIRTSALEQTIQVYGAAIEAEGQGRESYTEIAAVSGKLTLADDSSELSDLIIDSTIDEALSTALTYLTESYHTELSALQQLQSRMRENDDRFLELETLVSNRSKQVREFELELRDCISQERMLIEQQVIYETKLGELTAQLESHQSAWVKLFGQEELSSLEIEAAALEQQDRTADELRERIEKSGPILEGMQAELERLRQQVELLQRDHLLLTSQASGAAERAAAQLKTLRSRVGDEPVEGLISAATAALGALRERVHAARTAHEDARAAHAAAAERRSAAAEGASAAARALTSAERRLREALEA
ncbi:SMC family ATPase, partial [Paenibacillus albiflavus]